ncbi:MAG: stage III sporulation protein AD [Clostridia bacterium]|nr:stage III sporulation protein AD [Clostridia bacterium]
MEDIIKIIAVGLIAVIIVIIIKQYKPEFAIYVSIITGAIILYMIFGKLQGIINLLQNISSKAGVNSQFLSLLLKITGIAFLAEFAINICKDAGEGAIASKIEIGSKVIIVSMSIPIISSLLDVILKLL